LGGASVISTSAMFADELCGRDTTGSRMEKDGSKGRVDCKGGAGCECLMATHKCRQLLPQRRLETRKLGSKPNPLASDPDLDKIRCAAVIGAIGHVGRNWQPRRHSRASRLPLTRHSFPLSQHPRKTPTTRLSPAFCHPLVSHSHSVRRWHSHSNINWSYAPFQNVNISHPTDCHLTRWSCLQ
jgi:hypothetical protein